MDTILRLVCPHNDVEFAAIQPAVSDSNAAKGVFLERLTGMESAPSPRQAPSLPGQLRLSIVGLALSVQHQGIPLVGLDIRILPDS